MDDIYYPEDFLMKGLFAPNPKSCERRYIDKRADLAYPLSEKIVLRNENVMDLADLDGRIYKYIDEL